LRSRLTSYPRVGHIHLDLHGAIVLSGQRNPLTQPIRRVHRQGRLALDARLRIEDLYVIDLAVYPAFRVKHGQRGRALDRFDGVLDRLAGAVLTDRALKVALDGDSLRGLFAEIGQFRAVPGFFRLARAELMSFYRRRWCRCRRRDRVRTGRCRSQSTEPGDARGTD
jgi:hypothetical protein